ncbi:MAG: NAD+ synthase [Candidatus Omnitrophica bacterium]|nr:NAD+ synthase [Candidatus Omnitrophota bacterium]
MKVKIIRWIQGQVRSSKAQGIVMGLSGGIDSSVVAALSRKAVGKEKFLGLILPCHSNSQDYQDAKLFARKFGIRTKVIDLTKTYDALLKVLPSAGSLARSNLKPRLRMLVLYYYANKFNYLVCGTGNRSELLVGYFTKHGDGAVDLLPIGNLFKKQVVSLAKELSIPERIIQKAPSAGLWQGQTDESEMGISYAELDGILESLVLGKRSSSSNKKITKVRMMQDRSAHKRALPAIYNP